MPSFDDFERITAERDTARARLDEVRIELGATREESDRFGTQLEQARKMLAAARRDIARLTALATGANAENAQWQAEFANLRGLISGRHDGETIPVEDIRRALRDGPPLGNLSKPPVPPGPRPVA